MVAESLDAWEEPACGGGWRQVLQKLWEAERLTAPCQGASHGEGTGLLVCGLGICTRLWAPCTLTAPFTPPLPNVSAECGGQLSTVLALRKGHLGASKGHFTWSVRVMVLSPREGFQCWEGAGSV